VYHEGGKLEACFQSFFLVSDNANRGRGWVKLASAMNRPDPIPLRPDLNALRRATFASFARAAVIAGGYAYDRTLGKSLLDRYQHDRDAECHLYDPDHSCTKTKSPQTNGICERFHKTLLNEFYRVVGGAVTGVPTATSRCMPGFGSNISAAYRRTPSAEP
jgi:transposase InsO family protein